MDCHLSFKYYLLIVIIAVTTLLTGCGDSLGIESNVRTTLIDSVAKPLPKNTKFLIDTISITVIEEVRDAKSNQVNAKVPWIVKINYDSIYVDIKDVITSLWAKLDFENISIVDSSGGYYLQRVKAIQFIIDSIPTSGSRTINGDLGSGNWSLVALEDVYTSKLSINEGRLSPLTIRFFEDVRYKNSGYIKLKLLANVPNANIKMYNQITCDVYLGFKIK